MGRPRGMGSGTGPRGRSLEILTSNSAIRAKLGRPQPQLYLSAQEAAFQIFRTHQRGTGPARFPTGAPSSVAVHRLLGSFPLRGPRCNAIQRKVCCAPPGYTKICLPFDLCHGYFGSRSPPGRRPGVRLRTQGACRVNLFLHPPNSCACLAKVRPSNGPQNSNGRRSERSGGTQKEREGNEKTGEWQCLWVATEREGMGKVVRFTIVR